MNKLSVYDELDSAIEQMLAAPESAVESREPRVAELMKLASDLRHLPRENFKTRLCLELKWEAAGRAVSAGNQTAVVSAEKSSANQDVLTSLFGKNWSGYPVRRMNFAMSVAAHAIVIFLVGAGFLMVKSALPQIVENRDHFVTLQPYILPATPKQSGGGGSGGDQEKSFASRGIAPKAAREQLTPPLLITRNQTPRLIADATIIAPPDLNAVKERQIGDPLSALTQLSNGPGISGGIGGNFGGGVGTGRGVGRGNGVGGGCCDGVYTPGNGISQPRPIYAPEPEFSDEARRVKFQGDVTLAVIIGMDGRPRNLSVVRSLGMGLDEKAIEAVRTWRFEPARMNGRPVAVQMNIIVNFHLY